MIINPPALLAETQIGSIPASRNQADLAHQACPRYDQAMHFPRRNDSDGFIGARADKSRRPLLFKVGGFAQTETEPALKD